MEYLNFTRLFAMTLMGVVLGACAGFPSRAAPAAEARHSGTPRERLIPAMRFPGGWLASRADPNGLALPGSPRRFVNFQYPTAISARGPDLYVVDSGARKLYRLNIALNAMTVVPGVDAVPSMRVQAAADQSLFVLDTARSVILRYSREGHPLQTLTDPLSTSRLTEFTIDETLGRMYAVDGLSQRLVMLRPFARTAVAVASAEPSSFTRLAALATAGRALFAIDDGCTCIVVLDEDGHVSGRIGEGVLVQPRTLAVDRQGRLLYVGDGFDRTLRIFDNGEPVARYSARDLRLLEISALALDEGVLYIADGPGGQIATFRTMPAAKSAR